MLPKAFGPLEQQSEFYRRLRGSFGSTGSNGRVEVQKDGLRTSRSEKLINFQERWTLGSESVRVKTVPIWSRNVELGEFKGSVGSEEKSLCN